MFILYKMSKKFSKTRKISRKQRSKRNKKTRSNRKRGGDVFFKSTKPENPNKATLEGLYEEAINKFNPQTEEETVYIRDAIDNLSQLGTKVHTNRDSTDSTDSTASTASGFESVNEEYKNYSYNLDNYTTIDALLKSSQDIAKKKIEYMENADKMKGIISTYGVVDKAKKAECVKECRELGLAQHTLTGTLKRMLTTKTIQNSNNCENEICT